MACREGFLKKLKPGAMPRICRREDGDVQVNGRGRTEQALEPTLRREGAMPRKGTVRTVSSQVSTTVFLTVGQMPDDKGCITEEPCARKPASTVLKQRWMERSVHRL